MSRALGLVPLLVALLSAAPAAAQTESTRDRPPSQGGEVYQLGMPPVWKGQAGGTSGGYRPGTSAGELTLQLQAGIFRDLGSPVMGIAALGVEAYGGLRGDDELDGGARALFSIPSIHFTTGADYNVRDAAFSWLLRLELPIRRGGIFGGGSQLRLDYLPSFDHTFALGVSVPLWGRNIGETRPQRDAVELGSSRAQGAVAGHLPPGVEEALANVLHGGLWIAELSMPLTDRGGPGGAGYAADLERIRGHVTRVDARFPGGHTLLEEIRVFHHELDRAFVLAARAAGASRELGLRAAAAGRRALLEHVLLPYDRLLGQRKKGDGLDPFLAVASAAFGRWLIAESGLDHAGRAPLQQVFDRLGEVARRVHALQRSRWEDNRHVWLPLQLALRAEDHDEQQELVSLIEMATGGNFTQGNESHYLFNEAFQHAFLHSVHEAEDYHVLWIHDYRGLDDAGDPDAVGFRQTVHGYLTALADRVERYDRTGKLTSYFLFLDQHYFEIHGSRIYLRVLLDPMEAKLDLPAGYEAWEAELAAAQARLRRAVAGSRQLQTELRQYGASWLRQRLRVHVSVTNPADTSFVSLGVTNFIPMPDNAMRDHRKIIFFDVTEEDPHRGLAMFTGAGIGEHYAGPGWEDRALVIRGPAALAAKDAARELLLKQGFRPHEIPFPLRERERTAGRGERAGSVANHGAALQLHNQTGFGDKPINVEKAILYSLMPGGSLLVLPDSLWLSHVYASLLAGSALRGCDVLIIAPTLRSAPSAEGPTRARMHGLLSAVIGLQRALSAEIAATGGGLHVGLYAPRAGVDDLAARARQARALDVPWLRALFPPNPAIDAALDGVPGARVDAPARDAGTKLHVKANLFVTGQAWRELMSLPEWGRVIRESLRHGEADGGDDPDTASPDLLEALHELATAMEARLPGEAERRRSMAFFTFGSANLNDRSMVMDGEVQVTLAGWSTLAGVTDFVLLVRLCEWIDTQEELDALLPPPGWFNRGLGDWFRLSF